MKSGENSGMRARKKRSGVLRVRSSERNGAGTENTVTRISWHMQWSFLFSPVTTTVYRLFSNQFYCIRNACNIIFLVRPFLSCCFSSHNQNQLIKFYASGICLLWYRLLFGFRCSLFVGKILNVKLLWKHSVKWPLTVAMKPIKVNFRYFSHHIFYFVNFESFSMVNQSEGFGAPFSNCMSSNDDVNKYVNKQQQQQ